MKQQMQEDEEYFQEESSDNSGEDESDPHKQAENGTEQREPTASKREQAEGAEAQHVSDLILDPYSLPRFLALSSGSH